MAYANQPTGDYVANPVVADRVGDYHDRVRWGPIISGLVVALATQLVLSALFGAIGAGSVENSGAPRTISSGVASNVGIGSIIGLLISLFTGGWVTARACGPMSRSTAILNGAILWATTLALSSWLIASGVSGAFGVAASNAGEVISQVQQQGNLNLPANRPNVSAQQAREAAANVRSGLWWFVLGSLLGLLASIMGAVTGTRKARVYQ
ncbi:MAG: hypothetical protein KME29_37215 [Calothrix sp. FI2-JRJ7]|jgi:hypothetical protein|nr:hypothetical protein [Calothrix sp. FI2-JRJ7]